MYYSYDYPLSYSFYYYFFPVLTLILTAAGGLALYFAFVRKPNTFQGAAAKLHDILNFRKFFSEALIRILYCLSVAALTIYSIILLFSHVFLAILLFVGGNCVVRLLFEFAMLLFSLCRNTQEINRKMGPLPEEPAPQQPVAPPPAPAQQAPVPPVAANTQPPIPPVASDNQPPVPPQEQADPKEESL